MHTQFRWEAGFFGRVTRRNILCNPQRRNSDPEAPPRGFAFRSLLRALEKVAKRGADHLNLEPQARKVVNSSYSHEVRLNSLQTSTWFVLMTMFLRGQG